MKKPRVLIIGAGIAGLALARALMDQGVTAEVVERTADWRTSGAGLYLPANAVREMYRLGIGDEVARRAQPVKRQRLLDHRGRLLTEFDVRNIWGETGDCFAISRNDLHEVLRAAVRETTVRLGVTVTGVDASGSVTFADGSSDAYDLVVGADGIHSTVRRSVFGNDEPRFLGQLCWRFIAQSDPQSAESTDWTVRLGSKGRTFLTVPLGDGQVYCYADTNSTEMDPPVGDWRTIFDDFTGPVSHLLEQGADAYFSPLSEITGSDWTRSGVALIGDAAHACSPSMAQGGAMAMEDALVLAELLGAEPVEAALPAFKARRSSRVQWVLDQNRRRDKARNLPTVLRNLSLRLAGERLFKANHAPLHTLP